MRMQAEDVVRDAALLLQAQREPLILQQGDEEYVLLTGEMYRSLTEAWEMCLRSRAQGILWQNREAFEELAK